MTDRVFICFEYTKDSARIPPKVRRKLMEFFDKLDSWILQDPVLGDPEISTTYTLLETFLMLLREFEIEPIRLIKLFSTYKKTELKNKLKHGLE